MMRAKRVLQLWTQSHDATLSPSGRGSAGARHNHRSSPAVVLAALLALATFAAVVFAASAPGTQDLRPSARLAAVDGETVVVGAYGPVEGWTYWRSADGVLWWQDRGPEVPALLEARGGLREACAGDVCYRVAEGRDAIESSADAGVTWTVEWDGGAAGEDVAMAVALLGVGDGAYVVVVPHQRDGVLVRGVDGWWTMRGLG